MGTSTSQPSPTTRDWQKVRELYERGPSSAYDVLAGVARAVGQEFERGMASEPVVHCLAVLMEHCASGAPEGLEPERAAQRTRDAARRALAEAGIGSRHAEAALLAVFRSALDHALAVETGAPTDAIGPVRTFVAHYVSQLLDHLIARDSSDYVGDAGLPTVGHRQELSEESGRLCAEAVGVADMAPLLRAVTGESQPGEIGDALSTVLGDVMERLRRGGAAA